MRPYYYLGNDRALTQLDVGHPFFVNTRDAAISPWIILGGHWETFVDNIFCAVVRPGDRVLDVGANMGYYTIKLGHIIGPQGKLVAFEPNPELFPILRDNVKINGHLSRTTIHQLALGDTEVTKMLNFDYSNMGGGSMIDEMTGCENSYPVSVVRGDTLFGPSEYFDVMKFDVEGYEPLAAIGLEETIKKSAKAAIVLEISPLAWRRFGDFGELLGRFTCSSRLAFEICHDGNLTPVDLSSDHAISAFSMREGASYMLMLPPNHWAMNFVRSKCRKAA